MTGFYASRKKVLPLAPAAFKSMVPGISLGTASPDLDQNPHQWLTKIAHREAKLTIAGRERVTNSFISSKVGCHYQKSLKNCVPSGLMHTDDFFKTGGWTRGENIIRFQCNFSMS
jgi:hypothetical protein